jgi:hypothetical protein
MKSATKPKSRPAGSTEAIDLPNPNEIDFLVYALGKIGGKRNPEDLVQGAASELGITLRKLYSIVDRGVGHLPYRQVVDIAKRAEISVHLLRMGGLRNRKSLSQQGGETMESTQATETKEPTEFEVSTSVGTVRIFATARDRLNILSAPDSSPSIMATIEFNDRWEPKSSSAYSIKDSTLAPASIVEELVALAGNWARSHPEEFERAGIKEYEDLIESCCEGLDRLLAELQETENDLRLMITESEVVRQAPAMLRSRLEDAAKMVHAMKLQVEAAAEAIDDAACEESDEGEQH